MTIFLLKVNNQFVISNKMSHGVNIRSFKNIH